MRIVAGKFRGRTLQGPKTNAIRPTSDRLRESIFNILAHAYGDPITGARVMDLFAGTGALGLEALSRGAAQATFMEKDRTAIVALRANIDALGETKTAAVLPVDARRPPHAAAPCTLAFLDPPYGEDLATPALLALAATGWLAPGALVVVEVAAKQTLAPPERFTLVDERRYGAAKLVFLRFGGG
jgi:16S rRNA (guanine966-N2)-methyltransferase